MIPSSWPLGKAGLEVQTGHSLETSSLLVVVVLVALWHRTSSGHIGKLKGSCPRKLHGSCVLRVPGGSF